MRFGTIRDRFHLPPPERKDASMDLLNQIRADAVDPEYAEVAARPAPPRRDRRLLALSLTVLGILVTLSVVQTAESAPLAAEQRNHLVASVEAANERIAEQRASITALQEANERRQVDLLAGDQAAAQVQAEVTALAPRAGAVPVEGPGVVIVVDDSADVREDRLNEVLDGDLQLLANGLWRSGAEAIAINGHRITSVSAIRSAGDAITVNYRSLTRPYTITAIGDPATLSARFAESPEGRLWQSLNENYALRFDVQQREQVELPADPSLTLRHARRLT